MSGRKDPVLKRALRDTLPVLWGYAVLGIGFGLLMRSSGFSPVWTLMMSLFIYAGAMQYLAVSLLLGGVPLITCALMTLMVNARHLFYGISMVKPYRDAGRIRPYLIFGLTDETYSLVCRDDSEFAGAERTRYFRDVTALDHLYWVLGSVLGSLAGEVLPFDTRGVEFALTAMFITLFCDRWLRKEDRLSCVIGALSALLCLLLFGKDRFLIPAMALIAVLLLLPVPKKERGNADEG